VQVETIKDATLHKITLGHGKTLTRTFQRPHFPKHNITKPPFERGMQVGIFVAVAMVATSVAVAIVAKSAAVAMVATFAAVAMVSKSAAVAMVARSAAVGMAARLTLGANGLVAAAAPGAFGWKEAPSLPVSVSVSVLVLVLVLVLVVVHYVLLLCVVVAVGDMALVCNTRFGPLCMVSMVEKHAC
jgi:hypothetical protein